MNPAQKIEELLSELRTAAGNASQRWRYSCVSEALDGQIIFQEITYANKEYDAHLVASPKQHDNGNGPYLALANPANITRLLDYIDKLECSNAFMIKALNIQGLLDLPEDNIAKIDKKLAEMTSFEKEIHDGLVLKASRGEYID